MQVPSDPETVVRSPEAPTVSATPPAGSCLPNLPPRLGPYELLDRIGHGGMGVVFRARHERLGHVCAVKVLIAGEHASPEGIARFQREAASVARLGKHPNIVTVHDLGQEGSLAWYAMELVEGRSLRETLARERVTKEGIARWVEKIARALHFVHAKGVIHRDLKPDNIVLGPGARPEDREPQVMDFGLALDASSSARISVTGDVFGSPNYMAPEQARGEVEATDARTDVYGIGGILYEALTSVPPHPGRQVAEILASAARGEVIPPRQVTPDIPRDLETICLKCLEAEPSRRYQTAEEVADDLARFLRREPIRARRAGWVERLWRRARRNPVVTALSAALIVAALVTLVLVWHAQRVKKDRELAVQDSLRWLNELGGALVDASLARRAMGDLQGSRSYAGRLVDATTRLEADDDSLAEPWYHEGRMLRAQLREEEAEARQDKAIERARRQGASEGSRGVLSLALYERGVLRGLRYRALTQKRKQEALSLEAATLRPEDPPPKEPKLRELRESFPDVAAAEKGVREDLEAAIAEARGRNARLEASARALLAVIDGDDGADDLLRKALSLDRYASELREALAARAWDQGEYEAAARMYEEGIDADRGYLPYHAGLVASLNLQATVEGWHGGNALALLDRALAAADRALALDARALEVWSQRIHAHLLRGRLLGQAGRREEAHAELEAAIGAAREALAINPRRVDALGEEALAWQMEGDARRRAGGDPSAECAEAMKGYEQALAVDPSAVAVLGNKAHLHQSVAEWKMSRGEDPTDEIGTALACMERVVAQSPRQAEAENSRGTLYVLLGDAVCGRGGDPSEGYRKAIESFDKALSLNHTFAAALNNRATIYLKMGDLREERGEDPFAEYQEAVRGYQQALAANPRFAMAANNAANAFKAIGEAKAARGGDPDSEYEEALDLLKQALDIDPSNAPAAGNLGSVHQSRGEALWDRGGDPVPELDKAAAAYERAIALDPSFALAVRNLASVWKERGDLKCARGDDADKEYQKALEGYERALAINPRLAEAAEGEGSLHMARAKWKRSRGADPRPDLRRAIGAYEKTIVINPRLAVALNNEAVARVQLAACAEGKEDPSAELDKALDSAGRALAINPRYAKAFVTLGDVHQDRANLLRGEGKDPCTECEAAIVSYEQARSLGTRSVYLLVNEGVVYYGLGLAELGCNRDPSSSYEKGLVAFRTVLSLAPQSAEGHNGEANVHQYIGNVRCDCGEDARDEYDQAASEYERVLSIDPRSQQALWYRGLILEYLGRLPEAAQAYEAALRRLEGQKEWLKQSVARVQEGEASGVAPWRDHIAKAREGMAARDCGAARDEYARALAALPRNAERDPSLRSEIGAFRYEFARACSVESAGKQGPDGSRRDLPEWRLRRLRDAAFDHLGHAIDLGGLDAAAVRAEADFAPLHDDPRWAEALRRLER